MHQGMIEARISAGCLLFMHRDCTDTHKSDIADCVLYTQLAATKKHERFAATPAWNETWLAAFTRFGGMLKAHEAVSCPALELGPGSVWAWMKSRLPLFIPGAMVFESESAAWRALSSHPAQPAFDLLAAQVLEPKATAIPGEIRNEQKVVMQIAFLDENSTLSVVLVTFTHRLPLTNDFLFEPLQPGDIIGNVELRFYSLRLMDLVYSPFRQKISQALEDRRPTLVSALAGADA
ncbi:hypothetical protein [Pseudomonas sp. W2-17]|uniref:hypothetical protein n=1 Tax=Pseudomonas sp. W2-17 TaxID=3058039 RepID=UPI0034E0CDC4